MPLEDAGVLSGGGPALATPVLALHVPPLCSMGASGATPGPTSASLKRAKERALVL